MWLNTPLYKMALYDSTNVLIWTVDNIGGFATLAQLAASGGSDLIGYLPAGAGAVATTVQAKLREIVSVKDFGAVGDNSTDDTAAIQAAINQLTDGSSLYFPAGTYKITNEITLPDTLAFNFFGDGKRASRVVQYTANKNGFISLSTFATGPNECSIRDMGIAASNNTSGYGLDTSGIKRSNLLNVEFSGWGYLGSTGGGVRIFNSLILTFTNCSFYSCYYGIFNDETASTITMWNGGGLFGCTFENIKDNLYKWYFNN